MSYGVSIVRQSLSAGHAARQRFHEAAAKRFSGIKGAMGSRYLQTNGMR
jgi:hypothetical protein